MSQDVGGRSLKLAVGWCVGCVGGFLVALLAAIWTDVAFSLCPLGVFLGGGFGTSLTHLLTSTAAGRQRIVWWGGGGTLVGATLGGAMVAAVIAARLPNPITSVDVSMYALIVGVFTLAGVIAGAVCGTDVAAQWEKREQGDFGSLFALQRAEPENAIEPEHDPLDESRRAAIQTWDADRLTEARRKLDGAASVEELDA